MRKINSKTYSCELNFSKETPNVPLGDMKTVYSVSHIGSSLLPVYD